MSSSSPVEPQIAPAGDQPAEDVLTQLAHDGRALVQGTAVAILVGSVLVLARSISIGHPWYVGGAFPGAVLSSLTLLLVHWGQVKFGLSLLLWSAALLPVALGMNAFGVNSPGLFLLPITIMTGCLMLRQVEAVMLAATTLLAFVATYLALSNGQVPARDVDPVNKFVVVLLTTLLGAFIGVIGSRALRMEFARARALARSLSVKANQLERSEASFAALFRSNPLPSITGDANGRIQDVNAAWLVAFGHRPDQVLGRTPDELGIYGDPDDAGEVIARTQARQDVIGRPVNLRLANGQLRSFLVSVATFRSGDDWRFTAVLIDQTDRLAAEEAQRALNVELERRVEERTQALSEALAKLESTRDQLVQSEKLAALAALVAGISHELNTPVGNALTVTSALADLQGELETQMSKGLSRSALERFLASVREVTSLLQRNLDRSARLIRSFKELATRPASEQRQRFALSDLINEVAVAAASSLHGPRYELRREIPADLSLDSYPEPLGQVLQHLFKNAVEHGFAGRTGGRIQLSARQQGERVVLVFADNGVGIPQRDIERVFEPFFTTTLGQGGSGLGLTIVHNIVTATLGGRIELKSTVGQGCEFRMELPLVAP